MPKTIINAKREERARLALVAYKGAEPGPAEGAEMIIDLLTDLHHVLAAQGQMGVDDLLDGYLSSAHAHYFAETHGHD